MSFHLSILLVMSGEPFIRVLWREVLTSLCALGHGSFHCDMNSFDPIPHSVWFRSPYFDGIICLLMWHSQQLNFMAA